MMNNPERLGVLIFHPANVFGGAERTLSNLLLHHDRSRFRLVLAADPAVFENPTVAAFHPLAACGLGDGFSTPRRALADARALAALARREQCTVVLGMLHYGAIVAALCRPLSAFRLRTIASPRTPSAHGIRFHVGERGPQVRMWQNMVRLACRLPNRVLVASHGLRDECITVYGARAGRVSVVPNSVDDSLLDLAAHTQPTTRPQADTTHPWRLITAGRLSAEKDGDTLLRALALLRQSLPVSLEFVGDGPQRPALEALSRELGLDDAVIFSGFTPHPLERVKHADIFVHTAFFEGFGNVLLEAMACGIPLVATDCDFGPREIITHGHNGWLVPVGDPHALAAQLAALLTNPSARQAAASAGLATVARFGAQRMARAYEAVFAAVAGQPQTPETPQ